MADTEQDLGSSDVGGGGGEAAADFPTVEPLDAENNPAKENFLPEGHDTPTEE